MQPKDILSNLSTHLKNTVAKAIEYAANMHNFEVSPLHLLLAMSDESGCLGAEVIQKLRIPKEEIEHRISHLPFDEKPPALLKTLPELNKAARTALEKAMLLAYEYQHKYVGTEHLLFGLLVGTDKDLHNLIKDIGISKKEIDTELNSVLSSTSKFPQVEDVTAAIEEIQEIVENQESSSSPDGSHSKQHLPKKPLTALDVFTTNLTAKEAQKNIDPVIGRELEIERMIDILCRRTKNNPVLVGEPGVGKTAIVEGLAKRIAEGNVPDILRNKKILSLDLALLVSGTIYRGEFEARLKQTIEELTKKEDTILFVDELHNIIGAGSNQGTMDAANILKPALARGQLRCIGATTLDEFKKYISSDPALERRFQSIVVEEPTRDDTIKILQGLKKNYEEYHHVQITDEAVVAAVDMSIKYIHDNFLPDKAIDLLDEGSASVKVRQKTTPLQKEIFDLIAQKENLEKEKQEAIVNEKFTEANKCKEKIEKIDKKLTDLNKKKNSHKGSSKKKPPVQKADIARVLHHKLHIDENVLLSNEWNELATLGKTLKESLVGQDLAIDTVVSTLKRAYLNNSRKKPLASFLFAGPSGVGKTALAKLVAEKLYHSDQALLKLDMSEFAEQHGISKLLGSPAGYIGYKERNQFTDKMKRRPFSVVLFDEIDKAHPDVIRLLLQILDEGELTDSSGKKINFKNAIIVLTTNLGSELYKSTGIGFGHSSSRLNSDSEKKEYTKNLSKAVEARLRSSLDSALLGRMSAVINFESLGISEIETIVQKRIDVLSQNFQKNYNFSITPEKSALQKLAQSAFQADEGARLTEKVVDETINTLAIEVLEQKNHKNKFLLQEKEGKVILG